MRMYSQQLANIVKNVFEDSSWDYTFEEEYGAFSAGLDLRCQLKSCDVIVLVGEEFIDSLALINISVDEDKQNEVVEFIKVNQRNPSKHRIEEHNMLSWIKQQRKLVNVNALKPERVEPFNKLLVLIEQFKRKNQYQ